MQVPALHEQQGAHVLLFSFHLSKNFVFLFVAFLVMTGMYSTKIECYSLEYAHLQYILIEVKLNSIQILVI